VLGDAAPSKRQKTKTESKGTTSKLGVKTKAKKISPPTAAAIAEGKQAMSLSMHVRNFGLGGGHEIVLG
jgi:hypothetical protein